MPTFEDLPDEIQTLVFDYMVEGEEVTITSNFRKQLTRITGKKTSRHFSVVSKKIHVFFSSKSRLNYAGSLQQYALRRATVINVNVEDCDFTNFSSFLRAAGNLTLLSRFNYNAPASASSCSIKVRHLTTSRLEIAPTPLETYCTLTNKFRKHGIQLDADHTLLKAEDMLTLRRFLSARPAARPDPDTAPQGAMIKAMFDWYAFNVVAPPKVRQAQNAAHWAAENDGRNDDPIADDDYEAQMEQIANGTYNLNDPRFYFQAEDMLQQDDGGENSIRKVSE